MRSALKNGFVCLVAVTLSVRGFAQSNPLVGTWRLVAADKVLPDGRRVADYGSAPNGIVVFTADNQYVLEIFKAERMKFASGDRAKGTPEEYKDAVLSASCHFGTYVLDAAGGTITFKIEQASYPNWDGSSRVSPYTLAGDTLMWRVTARPDGSVPLSVFRRVR
jgi:Lipocalin-like domain